MLRNRMLGGVSFLPLFAPEGLGGGGGEGEEPKHTDVLLAEIAGKAFDDAAAAADDGAVAKTGAEVAGKATGAEKPAGSDRSAQPAKRDGEPAVGDRGDGRTKGGQFAAKKGAGTDDDAGAAAKSGADGTAVAAQPKAGEQQPGQDQQQQQQADKAVPPRGWSPTSKAAWDKLPETVRADIVKREVEIAAGFKQYEQYEGVRPFAERATKSGQTLAQALTAYTGIEDLIRRDFAGGVMHIAQNSGLTQHEAAATFAKLATRLGHQFQAPAVQSPGGSPPDQNGGADPQMLQKLLEPVLAPILQRVNTIDTTLSRQAEGVKSQRLTESQRTVETFRQDPAHKYYDNVEQTIGDLLERGVVPRTGDLAADLKAAYETACWQNPEIRELLINERTAPAGAQQRNDEQTARARAASRSVTGAPAAGAREASRAGGNSLQSAAEQAYDQVAGRI